VKRERRAGEEKKKEKQSSPSTSKKKTKTFFCFFKTFLQTQKKRQIGIDQLDQNKAVNKKGGVVGAFKGAFRFLSMGKGEERERGNDKRTKKTLFLPKKLKNSKLKTRPFLFIPQEETAASTPPPRSSPTTTSSRSRASARTS